MSRPFYHLLQDEANFHRLYAHAFAVLDDVFVEEQATYMMFPKVLQITKDRLYASITTKQESLPAILRPPALQPSSASSSRRPPVQARVIDDDDDGVEEAEVIPPAFDRSSSSNRGGEGNLARMVLSKRSSSSSVGEERRPHVISI